MSKKNAPQIGRQIKFSKGVNIGVGKSALERRMDDLDHLQTIESEEVQPTEEMMRNPMSKLIHNTGHPVR